MTSTARDIPKKDRTALAWLFIMLDAELAREALHELTGSRGPEPMGLRTWTPGEDDILAGGRLPVVVQVCIPFLAEQLEHADLEAAA